MPMFTFQGWNQLRPYPKFLLETQVIKLCQSKSIDTSTTERPVKHLIDTSLDLARWNLLSLFVGP